MHARSVAYLFERKGVFEGVFAVPAKVDKDAFMGIALEMMAGE